MNSDKGFDSNISQLAKGLSIGGFCDYNLDPIRLEGKEMMWKKTYCKILMTSFLCVPGCLACDARGVHHAVQVHRRPDSTLLPWITNFLGFYDWRCAPVFLRHCQNTLTTYYSIFVTYCFKLFLVLLNKKVFFPIALATQFNLKLNILLLKVFLEFSQE